MLEITNLAKGAVIGVGLAWLLERWVMNLFDQVSAADSEEFPQNTVENSSKLFSRWRIFAGMSIAAAALAVTTGCRETGLVTQGPKGIFEVLRAT